MQKKVNGHIDWHEPIKSDISPLLQSGHAFRAQLPLKCLYFISPPQSIIDGAPRVIALIGYIPIAFIGEHARAECR